jgi:hypothetical protein
MNDGNMITEYSKTSILVHTEYSMPVVLAYKISLSLNYCMNWFLLKRLFFSPIIDTVFPP